MPSANALCSKITVLLCPDARLSAQHDGFGYRPPAVSVTQSIPVTCMPARLCNSTCHMHAESFWRINWPATSEVTQTYWHVYYAPNFHSSSLAGPRAAPLLRGISQTTEWCEPLQGSGWLAQATQHDTEGVQLLAGALSLCCAWQALAYLNQASCLMALILCSVSHRLCSAAGTSSHASPQQVTKYMPLYYKHAAGQTKGEDNAELEDKLQELQQQTLAMHTKWQQQQAAAHACKLPAMCSTYPTAV